MYRPVLPETALSDVRRQTCKEQMAAVHTVCMYSVNCWNMVIPQIQSVVDTTKVKYIA
jgi:hypothetical protein